MTPETGVHDPAAVFDALTRHSVDHVTVGGLAVGYWGYPRATVDTDIVVPDRDQANDQRLHAALRELQAEPLPLAGPGARALGITWNPDGDVQRWKTSAGTLDVLRSPDGAPPYAQLRERSRPVELFGAPARMVAREDLVAMKLAAARLQDIVDLDALLDPRNTESTRAQLIADDRQLLAAAHEPEELGAVIDPCEHEVDLLRRALAPTSGRAQLERALARRARELRTVGEPRIAELAATELPPIPHGLERVAARLAAIAGDIEPAEQREFELLRERTKTPVWRRRERAQLDARLQQATDGIERQRSEAEGTVEAVRQGVQEIGAWWEQHGKTAVDVIAARRERYRRAREQLAERVRNAPEQPAGYITALIGERSTAQQHEQWDRAARCIETYAAQYGDGIELQAPAHPDRAQRARWERMRRAVRQLGVDAPGLDAPGQGQGPELGV